MKSEMKFSPSVTESQLLGTTEYYDAHAEDYYKSTVHLDLQRLYVPFLNDLVPGAHILDAGCGSGRDAKAFWALGYRVSAIDASREMARLAAVNTNNPCEILRFQDIEFKEIFDGIWACASLLHVPQREMDDVITRLVRALKRGGVFYVSLKEGDGEHVEADGRLFSYYTANSFRKILGKIPILRETAFWKTEELRSQTHRQAWLNFLIKRIGSPARP